LSGSSQGAFPSFHPLIHSTDFLSSLSMIILTEVTYLATSWSIYQEFGWQVFKRIGADRRIKKS
jgi:hypothetical protein